MSRPDRFALTSGPRLPLRRRAGDFLGAVRFLLSVLAATLSTAGAVDRPAASDEPRFSIGVFTADVTPPLKHPLQAGVGVKPVERIGDPLLAHGIVLLSDEPPIVVCSVDWCGIGGESHDRWRDALAEAARTTRARVLVCAIHQHDAPLADLEVERTIAALKLGRSTLDVEFHERAVATVADALKHALKHPRRLTHTGVGAARVDRVASTRRILGADGRVEFVRGSASSAPRAAADPEGPIDPELKTISFWEDDSPIASLSVYAVHPMSRYGQGRVSADFVGAARRRRQADDPGVLHFYANGCGGDLAAGKYNDGSDAAREALTERLHAGWKAAWAAVRRTELRRLSFRSQPLRLPVKDAEQFERAALERIVGGERSSFDERVRAAFALAWKNRSDAGRTLDLPVIDFGSAQLLLLPGEPFVEYQRFAAAQRPDSFVMTLGYGDYGPVYVPTDRAFLEGGYEPGAWSFVAPGVERALKDAIAAGLRTTR